MKRLATVISLFMLTTLFAANASAQDDVLRCTDLPPIAWDSAPRATARIVVNISLPRVTSAKELYLNALCGAQPAAVWDLIQRGEGGVIEIPRPLADALNEAIPYMPRVDFMYVRGGGMDREVAVILFANGYEGPFFELDRSGDDNPWTRSMVENAAQAWNKIPYELMRLASHWLHDAALFDDEYSVHLRALQGLIDIKVFTQTRGRGLASPLGTLFTGKRSTDDALNFWMHEIGHYVDFASNGVYNLAYASEGTFAGISKRNNTILGIPVPFWLRLRHDEAIEWRDERGGCESRGNWREAPWGYATHYGMCGELSVEDFADSMLLALGVTQAIRETDYLVAPWSHFEYAPRSVNSDPHYYRPARLYERTGSPDASLLGQKIDYIYEHYGIHSTLPQDADRDGVTYLYGHDSSDCSDINPVEGQCESTGCSTDAECDDGEACTVNVCREGQCTSSIRDTDGDGSPDSACGGSDCADNDPAIGVGSVRDCTGACGIQGEQQCVGGSWTECSAPTTCECDPTAPPQVVPCGNCAVQERHCNADGTWATLTACEPIDPTADGCTPGEVRTNSTTCSARMCEGRSIPREREETCNSQCNWAETQACTLTEPTTAEVCNGVDDDCDGKTDEGCPEDLTFVSQASQPLIAGTYPYGSGYPNENNCPTGYALVGFRLTDATFTAGFSSNKVLGAIKPICKSIELVQSGTEYEVLANGSRKELATHGKYDYFHQSYTCPSGQMIRGITVYRGWFIDRMKVHCAELDVTGSIGSYGLTRRNGASSGVMIHGTDTNASQHCQGSAVATGLRTKTGDVVDAIGLNCSNVTLGLQ